VDPPDLFIDLYMLWGCDARAAPYNFIRFDFKTADKLGGYISLSANSDM